ncbi:signal-regulatory protein beta-1-like [Erpetoichthys calabaricus]|uniref:Signal-regulatory protein beta-1-like n=1 Tax=Erpetoichthys calabaricus TaxID=27687 RepID=A0A8C4SDC9_ERPCA|nr:signal-regulatory protein beta-1-like [Erpetoichthys calabaricus]
MGSPLFLLSFFLAFLLNVCQDFSISQPQVQVKAAEGSDVTLLCLMSSETPVGPVKWFKGAGSERTHFYSAAPKGGDKNDPRVTWTVENTPVNFSITIRDVRVNDTGEYYCEKYTKGDWDKPYASGPGVTLTVKGEHLQSPVEAVEASGQILVCILPKETSVGHVKCYSSQLIRIRTSDDQGNEKEVSQIAWTEKNLNSKVSLTMRDVRGSDLDEYCEKYKKTSNGKPRGSDGLLHMTDINQPQRSVEAVEGGNVTLTCILSSEFPLGPIKWFKEVGSKRTHFYSAVPHRDEKNDPRVAWTMDKVTVDLSITIRNLKVSDTGEYYCVKYRKEEEDKPYTSGPGVTLTVRGA